MQQDGFNRSWTVLHHVQDAATLAVGWKFYVDPQDTSFYFQHEVANNSMEDSIITRWGPQTPRHTLVGESSLDYLLFESSALHTTPMGNISIPCRSSRSDIYSRGTPKKLQPGSVSLRITDSTEPESCHPQPDRFRSDG